jgi:endonuclease G
MVAVAVGKISGLLEQTRSERARVGTLVREGRWLEAEPDTGRLARYVSRHLANHNPPGAEAIQGDASELQAVRFLSLGSRVRRAVGYVEVTTPTSSETGTGFLISPRLFLTNAHVIADKDAAAGAVVTFDRELTEEGVPRPTTSFSLDPQALALFSDPDHLDYALIALGSRSAGTVTVDELGFCPLSDWDDKHALGMAVNIIQHPRGWLKMVAVRNNFLSYRTEQTLLYQTDTDQGSSGSPVFNDDWELVALHHWGEPHLDLTDDQGHAFPTSVNEGIRISAIYDDLTRALAGGALSPGQHELLAEALSYAKAPTPTGGGHVLSPPRPRKPGEANPVAGAQLGDTIVTVPLEITVRVGSSTSPPIAVAAPNGSVAAPLRTLSRGAEAVRIDQNYDNRGGYAPDFIAGRKIPLPKLALPALVAQLAPLHPDVATAKTGELKYQNFSVKINQATRIAIFTATNIDGPTYLNVDRQTGHVTGSEGDNWFKDTRISASYVLDQTFYGGWSDYFDRGHLTRRTDPTWGTPAEAERANADTFHFTNCSPQHFRFNESARFWQGIERYVLENGVLANAPQKRLCVFQGPMFDASVDRWADDVQIPSSFWKIVVWEGAAGPKAVGLVVDQLALLDESRVSLGKPTDLPSVDVQHWRVAIPVIESRTGLSFGDAVRKADTISRPGQPVVGEEATIRVTRFEDIQL